MKLLSPKSKPPITSLTAGALLSFTLISSQALALEVTGGFTGWWGQPDQQNHGVIVSISQLHSGEKTAVLYWANYDEQGKPSWLFAQGDVQGSTIQADLYQFDGITFMQPEDPNFEGGEIIGTMDIAFNDCSSGDVDFQTINEIVGTGGFRIQRLTNQPGAGCSGGIGDDVDPGTALEEFNIDLFSTGVISGAEGEAEFEIQPGKAEFEVEIEDVPVGEYELQVGEITRGTIVVTEDDDGDTEGEIEFRSPARSGGLLLDFDPRGQNIDVLRGGVIILTSVAPDSGTTPGQGDAPTFGDSEIEVDLINDGVYPAAEGEAELEIESDEVNFEVEIEDVPVGSYALLVGGIERGQIQVVQDDDGTEGEIEFRFPPSPGKLLLDFDPRGKPVEVFEGSTRIFHVDFPLSGGSDDDDGGNDGGNDDGNTSEVEIEIELTNTGVFPAASGEAEFEIDEDGEREFEVEIKDLPVGGYELAVGGVQRGTIQVVADDDGNKGEIEFSNPVDDDDDLLLDFDPRGQLIEIFDGETLIFTANFPS